MKLLEPHAPAGSKGLTLPKGQGGQRHGDDLGDSTLGFELGEETHLGYVKRSDLLCLALTAFGAV